MLEPGSALKIFSTSDEDARSWKCLFDRLNDHDKEIHFTVEYARAYERSFGSSVFLAVYAEKDCYLLMPFLLRDVRLLPFMAKTFADTPIYDMTSLDYSYGGPIGRIDHEGSSGRLHLSFQKALERYCCENGIVTQFTAFHPLLENHRGLQETGLVEVRPRKPVVWLDLRQDSKTLFRGMSRNHRRSIAKARHIGVEAGPQEWHPAAVDTFKKLYSTKMRSVGADARWLLPETYCESFMAGLGARRVSLFCAKHNGRVVASALTLRCNNTAYHHLIGANSDSLRLLAHHLLVYELALWAKAQGCWRLHLGGGLHAEDGIFRFKAGFSSCRSWLYTSGIIYNEPLYRDLCRARDAWDQANSIQATSSDFFPTYRR